MIVSIRGDSKYLFNRQIDHSGYSYRNSLFSVLSNEYTTLGKGTWPTIRTYLPYR